MNKIVQIKIFNDILDQLFDYLELNFPLFKSDVILTRSATEFIRRSNPRLVVEKIMFNLLPYKNHIFSCNEDFFLNFESNLTSSELTDDNILFGTKLKSVWGASTTTMHQKAYIWMYFQKLLKAGENVLH